MEAKQRGPGRQAGHDNEAEILQKLLRLLAGQGGDHETRQSEEIPHPVCLYMQDYVSKKERSRDLM